MVALPISLRRPDGLVYFSAEQEADTDWSYVRWYGIQTLEEVQAGNQALLDMQRRTPRTKLLADHRESVGRSLEANAWLADVWSPQASVLGLHSVAHVVWPHLLNQLDVEDLLQRVGVQMRMRVFAELSAAQAWLRQLL